MFSLSPAGTRKIGAEATPHDLSLEERNLLSVAYKNVVGARASPCAAISARAPSIELSSPSR